MVTNEIIETVALALRTAYPDIPVYADDTAQGLEPPAFHIITLETAIEPYPSGRYVKRLPLDILYYPSDKGGNREMLSIADALFPVLEFVTCSRSGYKDTLHGTGMRYGITDGVLHFFVNYDTMLRRAKEIPRMETITADIRPMMTIDQNIKEATDDA